MIITRLAPLGLRGVNGWQLALLLITLLSIVAFGLLRCQILLVVPHPEEKRVFLCKGCLVTALLHDTHLLIQSPRSGWRHPGLRVYCHCTDTSLLQLAQTLELLKA